MAALLARALDKKKLAVRSFDMRQGWNDEKYINKNVNIDNRNAVANSSTFVHLLISSKNQPGRRGCRRCHRTRVAFPAKGQISAGVALEKAPNASKEWQHSLDWFKSFP